MDLSASEAGEAGGARSVVDCGVSGRVRVVLTFERGGSGGGVGRGSGGGCGLLSGFSDKGATSLFCSGVSVACVCNSGCYSEPCCADNVGLFHNRYTLWIAGAFILFSSLGGGGATKPMDITSPR